MQHTAPQVNFLTVPQYIQHFTSTSTLVFGMNDNLNQSRFEMLMEN